VLRSIPAIAMAIQLSQPKVTPEDAQRFAAALHEQAAEHDFDPLTGVAMIFHESSFNPRAVSTNGEDWGLAQIRARHIGSCQESKSPVRNPTPECQRQKEALLEPEENIRVMAELITKHRNLCREKVGTNDLPRWLASYQGRNNIREQRWCTPAPATWKIIAFRDRLIRKLYRLGLLTKPA
jgi:transglycosylase-like protein with SLT domain